MKRVLHLFLIVFTTLSIVSCRTQRVIEKQILHDSIYITKDNVIYKFEKDSVQEKEKVHIYTKRDTLLNTDSVFVVKEKFVNHWKIRTDTITKVMYVSRSKTELTDKKKDPKSTFLNYFFNFWSITKVIFVLFIFSFILFRNMNIVTKILIKIVLFLRKRI